MKGLIGPHGGKLIDRSIKGDYWKDLDSRSQQLPRLRLNDRQISDIEMISIGAFSPLVGFMNRVDYHSVVQHMRLRNGLPWTIPITLPVSSEEAKKLSLDEDVALVDLNDNVLAVLHLEEKYEHDKEQEAVKVYGTDDIKHPGVDYIYNSGSVLLGGEITLLRRPENTQFEKYRFDPVETRKIFHDKGWKRVVGFQTRNPVHRAHEYIQKCALEMVDGLLLHPIVGATKEGDIPADIRMKCYEVLLKDYYPSDRVLLCVNPAAMRYAGPREAIFHALVRKNYGCTHFIVGRDHAGVGDYYGSFDAHHIFDEFDEQELGIAPMFFDYTFYCKRCQQMTSSKTCSHDASEHISLSGTKVRQLLRSGKTPPVELSRPEVAKVLADWVSKKSKNDK